jgi:hypothetical protein
MNEFTNKQDEFNQKQYKKYLSCGYTGEMTVNEYGWCDNEVRTGDMETIDLFDKDRSRAYPFCPPAQREMDSRQLPDYAELRLRLSLVRMVRPVRHERRSRGSGTGTNQKRH